MWAKHTVAPLVAGVIYAMERYADEAFPDVPANVWLAMSITGILIILLLLPIIYRPELIRLAQRVNGAWSRRRAVRSAPKPAALPRPPAPLSDKPPPVNTLAAFAIGLIKFKRGLDETDRQVAEYMDWEERQRQKDSDETLDP